MEDDEEEEDEISEVVVVVPGEKGVCVWGSINCVSYFIERQWRTRCCV